MACDKYLTTGSRKKKKTKPDLKGLPISMVQFQVTKVMTLKTELALKRS